VTRVFQKKRIPPFGAALILFKKLSTVIQANAFDPGQTRFNPEKDSSHFTIMLVS